MTPPSRPAPSAKERLLDAGKSRFFAVGYQGTTVDAVLADAAAPKGSFYHHFGAKQAFGFAVLDRYDTAQGEILRRWSDRDDLTVPERVAGYHRELVDLFLARGGGRACLVGKLSNELAFGSEAFRIRLAESFHTWQAGISALLQQGRARGEVRTDEPADRLAAAVLAMIEGAFAYALAVPDGDSLYAVNRVLVQLITDTPAEIDADPATGGEPTPSVPAEAVGSRDRSGSPRVPTHRQALLREGMNQFFEHGYFGTTVDGLLAATGVPKGSFYHHFGTKEQFAAEVLDAYGGFQSRRLTAWGKMQLPTTRILTGYFGEMCEIFVGSGFRNSDLTSKLATEVAPTSAVLRARLAHFVHEWRTEVEKILLAGRARGDVPVHRDPTDLSAALAALMNGAFLVVASTRDEETLAAVSAAIRSLV